MRIGITCGDPAGIGPETIIKLGMDQRMLQESIFIFYCPVEALQQIKKELHAEELLLHQIQHTNQGQIGKLNVISPKTKTEFTPGKPSKESASIAWWALESSREDLQKGHIDAVVTAPLSKAQIMQIQAGFQGHTEYYDQFFKEEGALMMLCNERLRVALVTNHIPLQAIAESLTKDAVFSAIKKLEASLKKDFNVIMPKIAVLGLNPHAGESGNIGKEEMEIISPAISAAKSAGILAFGPFSSDGFFGSGQCFHFDAVLSMYHDQGLTGFKAIAQDEGINFTAGLSVVRTSPGHGTAYDLVGTLSAKENGLRNAVFMAVDVVKNRINFKERNQNPLPITMGTKETA